MQLQPGQFDFPTKRLTGGPQVLSTDITLPQSFTKVAAILTGFVVEYSDDANLPNRGDHLLGEMTVRLTAHHIGGNTVHVVATLGLHDWSTNFDSQPWDDPFDGNIRFVIVAE